MKKLGDVKKGDTLYIVYTDINNDYQIGEAVVVGFQDWVYEDSDRYSDEVYGEYPRTNILYRFKHLNFSRSLEYCQDDTHMTDCVEYGADYTSIFSDPYIVVFTTHEEAKEYVVSDLSEQVLNIQEKIDNLKSKIEKYRNNISKINN
jgi:hypothetical protein